MGQWSCTRSNINHVLLRRRDYNPLKLAPVANIPIARTDHKVEGKITIQRVSTMDLAPAFKRCMCIWLIVRAQPSIPHHLYRWDPGFLSWWRSLIRTQFGPKCCQKWGVGTCRDPLRNWPFRVRSQDVGSILYLLRLPPPIVSYDYLLRFPLHSPPPLRHFFLPLFVPIDFPTIAISEPPPSRTQWLIVLAKKALCKKAQP